MYLIPRPNSVQTLLMVANRAIDRTSPDYIDVQVMNRVLGSGPSSRLFRIIREEKGYTYGVGSSFSASRTMNHFTRDLGAHGSDRAGAGRAAEAVQGDSRSCGPGRRTGGCQERNRGELCAGPGELRPVLGRWMEQREYGLPEDYWDTYPAKVMAVTADDVQRVAKKYVP